MDLNEENKENKLNELEIFFNSDLKIKGLLNKLTFNSIEYNDSYSMIKNSNNFYKTLNDIHYNFDKMFIIKKDPKLKEIIDNNFKNYESKLDSSGYDSEKFRRISEKHFTSMNTNLINEVKK